MNQYLLFFIGMALMVLAPGPDFMNVVGQSLRGSFRNGLMRRPEVLTLASLLDGFTGSFALPEPRPQ
jgi:hypothetical protein